MTSQARGVSGLLTAVGAGLAVFVAIGSLTWPLGRDQGIFAWAASIILDGGVPYKDAWDIKGPLSYYTYAFAQALFGRHEFSIRIFDLAAVMAGCWLLRRVTCRLNGHDRFGADCAAIFFALAYFGGGFWNTAQPDAWGGILILAAVALLLDPPWRAPPTMAVAGVLIGLAALLKPTFLIFLALPTLHIATEPTTTGRRIAAFGACILTVAATLGTAMLVLRQSSGGLEDFQDVLRFIFLSHASLQRRHLFAELTGLPSDLLRLGLLVPFLLTPLAVGFFLWRRNAGRQARLIALWPALALLMVVVQGKYWAYHWTPAVIAMAVTLGVAISHIRSLAAQVRFAAVRTDAVILLIFALGIAPAGVRSLYHSYQWPAYLLGMQNKQQYMAHFSTPDGSWNEPSLQRVSAYLAEHTDRNDAALVWGWDVVINVLSERKSPTRFGFSYPLVAAGPLQGEYRDIFVREITRAPPRYIVVDSRERWDLAVGSGCELLRGFPQFDAILHSDYALVNRVDAFQVWALRPRP